MPAPARAEIRYTCHVPLRLEPLISPPTSNRIGDVVYDRILDAIHRGELRPGDLLNDQELAKQLGASRTPVRESLLRLQQIGVVEFAPARYTRVAVIGLEQTIEAVAVWTALYRRVISEVFPTASDELIGRMRTFADQYIHWRGSDDPNADNLSVMANADFFGQPVAASANATLRRTMDAVVHVVRLGGMNLPTKISPDDVKHHHQLMLAAISDRDVEAGHHVLDLILRQPGLQRKSADS